MTQTFLEVGKKEKKKTLMSILNDENHKPVELNIIFINTKKLADFITTLLSSEEKPYTSIHSYCPQLEPEDALYVLKHGTCQILAPQPSLPEVWTFQTSAHQHFDMPSNVIKYIRRNGRTGCDGNLGCATSFYDHEFDLDLVGPLTNLLTQSGVKLPEFMGRGAKAGQTVCNEDYEW